jgi:hypothetical protein
MTKRKTMAEPKFIPVDLTEMQNAGVLMAVNERVLWPLGLALAWRPNEETGEASSLHIREWRWEDGHHEAIETEEDELTERRRAAFAAYVVDRVSTMPEDEAVEAIVLLGTLE